MIQGHVPARVWGFESPLRHHVKSGTYGTPAHTRGGATGPQRVAALIVPANSLQKAPYSATSKPICASLSSSQLDPESNGGTPRRLRGFVSGRPSSATCAFPRGDTDRHGGHTVAPADRNCPSMSGHARGDGARDRHLPSPGDLDVSRRGVRSHPGGRIVLSGIVTVSLGTV